MSTRNWFFLLTFVALLAGILCSCAPSSPSVSVKAPTPIPTTEQRKYDISTIYDDALLLSRNVLTEAVEAKADYAWFRNFMFTLLIALGISFALSRPRVLLGLTALALILGVVFGNGGAAEVRESNRLLISDPVNRTDLPTKQAQWAINAGAKAATAAQATSYQYIAAAITGIGTERMTCTDPIDHFADCSAVTSWYTDKEVNCRQVEHCDSEGKNCTTTPECDTKHVSWFDSLYRYYVVVNTSAKYLEPTIYDMYCVSSSGALEACTKDENGVLNDKRHPAVFLHMDWRAEKNAQVRHEAKTWFNNNYPHNERVPVLWSKVKKAMNAANSGENAATITAAFVGPYKNWVWASGSPEAQTSIQHYLRLKQVLASYGEQLGGPSGAYFNYRGLDGGTYSLSTDLWSEDGDLATNLNQVHFFGFGSLSRDYVDSFNRKHFEFQGATFGPDKQSINSVYVFSKEIVEKMGGLEQTAYGIKGWLQDLKLQGLLYLPKNATLVVVSADPQTLTYDAQLLETGLPFGNAGVKAKIRSAVSAPTPLDWEHLMGSFRSSYLPSGSNLNLGVTFTGTWNAGGIIGMLYEDQSPENVEKWKLDPNTDDCIADNPDRPGYMRHQMCGEEYRQAGMQIDETGRAVIMNTVRKNSEAALDLGGMLLVNILLVLISLVLGYFRFAFAAESSSYSRRRYSSW
jgi:hypothetical protein